MIGAIAQVAKTMGDSYVAQALAAFASVTAPPPVGPNPGGVAAGKGFLLAAAGMYAISGAASGAAGAIGGGGAGSGSRGAQAFRDTNSFAGSAKGEAVLVFEGDPVFDLSNPRTKERWRRLLEEFSNRRVHIRSSSGFSLRK